VLIPQEQHPDINFVGLLIGPRGNTLKAMEKDTGAKIIIRGKGSVKEGKVGRKDGQPLPGEDEPLHAFITAPNPEAVRKAVDKIKDVIRQGIEVPEGHNDLRRMQLRNSILSPRRSSSVSPKSPLPSALLACRSPSPEPIYSSDGKRLNTREFRYRKRLEEQRHQLIVKMQTVNPEFKPPADYK